MAVHTWSALGPAMRSPQGALNEGKDVKGGENFNLEAATTVIELEPSDAYSGYTRSDVRSRST